MTDRAEMYIPRYMSATWQSWFMFRRCNWQILFGKMLHGHPHPESAHVGNGESRAALQGGDVLGAKVTAAWALPHRGGTAKCRQAEPSAGNGTHWQPQHREGMNQGQGPPEGAARSKKWHWRYLMTWKKSKCTGQNRQIIWLSAQENRKVKL